MDNSPWLDRLYSDESLTDNLDDSEAERLFRWGELRLAACASEEDAILLFDTIRELNRRVGEGESFESLISPRELEFPPAAPDSGGDAHEP